MMAKTTRLQICFTMYRPSWQQIAGRLEKSVQHQYCELFIRKSPSLMTSCFCPVSEHEMTRLWPYNVRNPLVRKQIAISGTFSAHGVTVLHSYFGGETPPALLHPFSRRVDALLVQNHAAGLPRRIHDEGDLERYLARAGVSCRAIRSFT